MGKFLHSWGAQGADLGGSEGALLSALICQFSSNLVYEDFGLHPHAHFTHFSTPACVRICEISHICSASSANSIVCSDSSNCRFYDLRVLVDSIS